MNDNEFIAGTICEQLEAGSHVVLVSIVESRGSSPRHTGTRMVVASDGKTYGTIGGGLLEAKSIAESMKALKDRAPRLVEFTFAGNAASTDEMLCGGNAKLFFDLLLPDQHNVRFFEQYRDLAEKGEEFYVLTAFKGNEDRAEIFGRALCLRNGTLTGALPLSEESLQALRPELRQLSSTGLLSLQGITVVADPVRRTKTVYCFGAGHVAVPTAHMAAHTGFRVVVVDDRAEFANADRFPDAAEIFVPEDFARALENIDIDEDSYVVIMTRGHRHDRVVLEQALKTKAAYIGMMGSLRKRHITYSELEKAGFTKERLAQVHCPIGLPIEAETPEEIAVSIVAELVRERARQSGPVPGQAGA